jgi:hypothetical protein
MVNNMEKFLQHRQALIDIVQEVASTMDYVVYIDSDDSGLKIDKKKNSIEVYLVVNYVPVEGGMDYSNILLSIKVWNQFKVLKASKMNIQIADNLSKFNDKVKAKYQQELDEEDRLMAEEKQASDFVRKLVGSLKVGKAA